jgi:hypothetical protein
MGARVLGTGLPVFSWCNIPKWENYTKQPHNMLNGQKYIKGP